MHCISTHHFLHTIAAFFRQGRRKNVFLLLLFFSGIKSTTEHDRQKRRHTRTITNILHSRVWNNRECELLVMQWELKWPSSGKKISPWPWHLLTPWRVQEMNTDSCWMLQACNMHFLWCKAIWVKDQVGKSVNTEEREKPFYAVVFFFMLGWYITLQPKRYNLNCAILENELHYKNILVIHRAKHIKCKLEAISYLSFSNWHWREWTWKLGLSAGS